MVDNAVIWTSEWEAAQLSYMSKLTERIRKLNPIFADVGSYWGLYSLVAMQSGAFKKIYAFEADRHNFAQLQANLFLNNAAHEITAVNCAASDAPGSVKFFDSRTHPDGNRGGVGVVGDRPGFSTYSMEAVPLDDAIDVVGQTILMKIDVEGYEASVLRGMKRLISQNKIVMQVEVFDDLSEKVFAETSRLGLRKFHRIGDDHYLTNMSVEELGL
jgi:FkbM family methyltransferase